MWIHQLIILSSIFVSESFKLPGANILSSELSNSTVNNDLQSFGQLCNTTSDCQLIFTCKNNTCSCPPNRIARPRDGIWSTWISCEIPAGGNCNSDKYGQLKTFGKLFWSGLGLWKKEDKDCVPNSRCDGNTCVCEQGLYKDPSGHCTHQRTMFQQCFGRNEECQDTLICNPQRKRCECPSQLTFDIRTLKCHIPAGSFCDDFSNQDQCVPLSECVDKVCTCKFGYRKASDGTCGLDHGLPCDQNYSCADLDLVCRSGRCTCKYWAHQYYEDDSEECLGKVSAPCDLIDPAAVFLNDEKMKCTEFAVCVKRAEGPVCQCMETYAEDEAGKCIKSFGASCEYDSECDNLAQLVCINGKCACPDELQVFHLESRRCQGIIGSRCTTNSSLIYFREQGVATECTPNGFCEEKVDGLDGRCACKFGYETNERKLCERRSSKFMYGWNKHIQMQ